jgi:hypothetical protein
MEEVAPPPPAPVVPPLLPFDDPWQLRTQSCTFEVRYDAGKQAVLLSSIHAHDLQ